MSTALTIDSGWREVAENSLSSSGSRDDRAADASEDKEKRNENMTETTS